MTAREEALWTAKTLQAPDLANAKSNVLETQKDMFIIEQAKIKVYLFDSKNSKMEATEES